jgi:hypothetical protein
MTLPSASVVVALILCAAALLVVRRWRRRALETPAAPAIEPVLSVHDKPTIEFSAHVEQLRQCADNDAPSRALIAFDDEQSTTKHTFDDSMIEQLRGPQSGIVALLRDPLKTREISCVDIDVASTGLPRPSAQTRARAVALVARRKRPA